MSGGPVYDYGSVAVDTAVDRTFTVTNIGSRKATQITGSFYLSVNFSFAGGSFPGEGGTCGADLVPLESCTVAVRFVPRSSGTLESLLPLSYFDSNVSRTSAELTLRGKGVGG